MSEMTTRSPGAPMIPEGNPMLSNMGPAGYANRANVPDLTLHGLARIVPLRAAPGFHLDDRSPDARGMTVIGADQRVAGTVVDIWVDRAEPSPRYYEVEVSGLAHTVLLPFTCARIRSRTNEVLVKSILSSQFAQVPAIASPERITLLEEDRIMAYFASGYLYATPER
ncbi:MAG: PRC-barrel domain-containing protein, partial [Phycisphaerae bacterium]|nr:PRC-barrel domain-containing protein [Gemmatimonadaceae bacterium]